MGCGSSKSKETGVNESTKDPPKPKDTKDTKDKTGTTVIPVKGPSISDCTSCKSTNKAVLYCYDCPDTLCQKCADEHAQSAPMMGHTAVAFTEALFCGEHKRLLQFYCLECNKNMCKSCCINKIHKDHPAEPLRERAKRIRVKIQEECLVCGEEVNQQTEDMDLKAAAVRRDQAQAYLNRTIDKLQDGVAKLEAAKKTIDDKSKKVMEARKTKAGVISKRKELLKRGDCLWQGASDMVISTEGEDFLLKLAANTRLSNSVHVPVPRRVVDVKREVKDTIFALGLGYEIPARVKPRRVNDPERYFEHDEVSVLESDIDSAWESDPDRKFRDLD